MTRLIDLRISQLVGGSLDPQGKETAIAGGCTVRQSHLFPSWSDISVPDHLDEFGWGDIRGLQNLG